MTCIAVDSAPNAVVIRLLSTIVPFLGVIAGDAPEPGREMRRLPLFEASPGYQRLRNQAR
ncbi:MAG TPA: hypothetical protein VFO16_19965 [Pseudonocardiaceae bacterium]|nr:hypothetical protein [Pseudonocardiaceae bacterium]